MEFWRIKNYFRFRYTRDQRKAMVGKIPMTEELFWGCMDIAWKRLDNLQMRRLMKTFPQFMRKLHKDYERRLREDAAFREEQEEESRRLKALCIREFGEEWVKVNWRD